MKCLSIRQPWAHAVCSGAKDVENRSWWTRYRGEILIHAGKTKADPGAIQWARALGWFQPLEMEGGAIIGRVELVDCIRAEDCDSRWRDGSAWCWLLRNPTLLERPIPFRGRLGLFEAKLPG